MPAHKNNLKKPVLLFTFILFFVSSPCFSLPNSTQNILGQWTSYDLQHTPRSVVRFDLVDGRIVGSIVKILSTKGQKSTDLCTKCRGINFNKPKLGMVIVWDLEKKDNKLEGKILDTDGGNIYGCQITTSEDNQTLYLHAYKGIPIFGATVNWVRLKNKG